MFSILKSNDAYYVLVRPCDNIAVASATARFAIEKLALLCDGVANQEDLMSIVLKTFSYNWNI